jgi:hypothetical protein
VDGNFRGTGGGFGPCPGRTSGEAKMGEASERVRGVATGAAERASALGKSVNKSHLVNRLNYMNFQDQTILVNLRHVTYDNAIFLRARPLPCAGERLECTWAETAGLQELLKAYRFDYLLIPDGKKYLLVNSEVVAMDERGISLVLPVTCHEFEARGIKRHPGAEVKVQMMQHGASFNGELVDFTPVAVRVTGTPVPPATFQWINPETPLNLRLTRGRSVLFSGAFEILSHSSADSARSLVLRQLNSNIRRFKTKKYRNLRQQLVPSPNVIFEHPLIGKRVNLKIADVSGSGFAVEENEGDSVLMAGLMIPDLELSFAHGLALKCTVQVVSRNVVGSGAEKIVRCGVAILEMDIRDHVKLLSILHQVANRRSYVCTEVDMDDLWDFFFETGFIYPGKYAHFQANKEEVKRTYLKLYGDNPQIARHFIYQDRGAILGHMAMVRFYENSWMFHHHAARKSVTIKAGLAVLDQAGRYLNELSNFRFAHLSFIYCYYRPDNKFPNRVFGGFARHHGDPGSCSLDQFAYFHYGGGEGTPAFGAPWEFAPSSHFDLAELGNYYRHVSGGLLTRAFDLEPASAGHEELSEEYRALGFRKERFFYSLRKEGALKAFFMVNCTDAGFNMADLTNCVSAVILDEQVPPDLVQLALQQVATHYEGGEMPVLTYPVSYLDKHAIPYDKVYTLWILDLQHSDDYFEFCEGQFRSFKRVAEES